MSGEHPAKFRSYKLNDMCKELLKVDVSYQHIPILPNGMEGFAYSQLRAEVKRRKRAAKKRANKALRTLLNDDTAKFHYMQHAMSVSCDGYELHHFGTSTGMFHGAHGHTTIQATRENITDAKFLFIADCWPIICAIRNAYKTELV